MACIRKRRGKWVVDYRDGAGIRRWKTYETKREAEDFLDVERPKTRQWSQSAVDPNITIGQYAVRWLELIKSTIKARTYTRYEELWRVHLKPTLKDVQVRQLHRGSTRTAVSRKRRRCSRFIALISSCLVAFDVTRRSWRPIFSAGFERMTPSSTDAFSIALRTA